MQRVDGIMPILVMPFTADETIDHASLARLVDFVFDAGAKGTGLGYGSEIFRLTEAERDEALITVAMAARGRGHIIVATGANSTRATVARSQRARELGGTLLMITPPAFAAGAGDDAVLRHYRTVADEVGLPIIVQDAPSMSGVTMSDALIARLCREIDLVVSVKVEVIPPAPKVAAVKRVVGEHATVLGGAGGIDWFHELGRGADGTIPGAAITEMFVEVERAYRAGDEARAREVFLRYQPLLALGFRSGDCFLYTQKEFLRRRGVLATNLLRSPHEPVDAAFRAEFDALTTWLGLDGVGGAWRVP
jgi:dihydrodipicolinate synthase/N-acetylneuraminate lyase